MPNKQLKLPETEIRRLWDRIYRDFLSADSNHQARHQRFLNYYKMWRGLNVTRGDKDTGPDFPVPVLKYLTLAQQARLMSSLLGDDAEIVAKPTAPSDASSAVKVGHYMTWRVFEYMQATNPLAVWVFRTILFGRAHAECTYDQEFYWERKKIGDPSSDKEVLCYDGPRLEPLWPSQIILPAQDNAQSINDFNWVIRRKRITPQQLKDDAKRGIYNERIIKENWDKIIAYANMRQERDYWLDYDQIAADLAEGVDHGTPQLGSRDNLEVWEWYGKWRFPTTSRDVDPDVWQMRGNEQDLLVTALAPRSGELVIGVRDLRDIYPRSKKRHPFLDLGLIKDGSYWCPGYGELLEDIQNEATINHALFRRAGQFSVGPMIFYSPGSGLDPETFEYKPFMAVPSEQPQGVKVVDFKANLEFSTVMAELLKSITELLTGVSDQTLGQAIDRPNAPRTAAGQGMLLQEGNVRASLDLTMLREDLALFLYWVWVLDREFSDDEVFFAVTEEDANGLYDTSQGFGKMTSEEREHPFGFDLKFATSVWSREAKKQQILALYQLSMQNPIVATNARALWVLLNRVWDSFGESNFKDIIPEPPEQDQPRAPKEEWMMSLRGDSDELKVNPLDDDQQHLQDHRKRLADDMALPEDRQDKRAQAIMVQHIVQHESQVRQKMMVQAMVQQAMASMQQAGGQQPQQPGVQQGALPPPGQIPPPAPDVPAPIMAPPPGAATPRQGAAQ